ncbi:MAG: hypothetical protein AVDCRST_MAG67-4311, partial [uncultured Solirubrobacteraceae bacterium]
AAADRHSPGHGALRRGRGAPVSSRARGRRAGDRRHRHRLRGHAVSVPRAAGLADRGRGRPDRRRDPHAPRGDRRAARVRHAGSRDRFGRRLVRGDARRQHRHLVAGPARRRPVRRARGRRRALADHARSRAPGRRRARRTAGLPRGDRGPARGPVGRRGADLGPRAGVLRLPPARRQAPRGREVRRPAHPAV